MDLLPLWIFLVYLAGLSVTFIGWIYFIRKTVKNKHDRMDEIGWCLFAAFFWPCVWIAVPFSLAMAGLARLGEYLLERE